MNYRNNQSNPKKSFYSFRTLLEIKTYDDFDKKYNFHILQINLKLKDDKYYDIINKIIDIFRYFYISSNSINNLDLMNSYKDSDYITFPYNFSYRDVSDVIYSTLIEFLSDDILEVNFVYNGAKYTPKKINYLECIFVSRKEKTYNLKDYIANYIN